MGQEVLLGTVDAFIGNCPNVEVFVDGVRLMGVLDTGSQVTLMRQSLYNQHFWNKPKNMTDSTVFTLKAANGLAIPYSGYAILDFEFQGVRVPRRGVVLVEDEHLTSPFLIGMNVISECWETVFEKPQAVTSATYFSRESWKRAFAVCQRISVTTGEDGYMGYVWPSGRRGIKVPASSEIVVWGRARMGPRGTEYCGLVEALPGPHPIEVARVVAKVRHGRIPIRIRNVTPCVVSIGRFQKLGRLFRVAEMDICGTRELDLSQGVGGQVQVSIVEAGVSVEVGEPGVRMGVLGDRPDLSTQQQGELQALFSKWGRVFADSDEDFGRTDMVQHQIPTGEAAPIRERFRPLPPAMYRDMKVLLAEMLESGVIRESTSPWAAPVVMVKKKDGSWRFCVDYRKLNAITHKDAFPLPRIEETLTTLTKSCWFSTLDLASGYWQVGMDPKDREKTAFTTPIGLYEFDRMPFGLCNAPATFQRLMQHCLSGQVTESVLVYLDDIIVYSPDFSSHLQHLDAVFARLWNHGLKLRPDKCKLLQKEVKFLGHVVDDRGVRPDPEKVSAVQECRIPATVRQVRAFLGLAGYYRRFIPGFAKMALPLNRLLAGAPAAQTRTRKVEWTSECQDAFVKLKAALTQAPVLAYADFSLPFVVYTDASNQGLGAVLAQVQGGRERVIAYASRSLHPTERNDSNYSSFKLELLALKWAVTEKFKDYLMGVKFTVFTDNNPVAHLRTAQLGATEQRWVAKLSAFDFDVKYRAGRENVNADALSRLPRSSAVIEQVEAEVMESIPSGLDGSHEDWFHAQENDPDLREVRAAVYMGRPPSKVERVNLPVGVRRLLQHWRKLVVHQQVLCRHIIDPGTCEERFQVVCPTARRKEVWECYHEATGHAGVERTLTCIRRHFFWPDMENEVREFQSGCVACSLQRDRTEVRAPLVPMTASFPLEVVGLDFLSLGRPEDTYQNILVMTDWFTHYAWAVPTRDQTALTTVKALWTHVISKFGCPMRFHADQGPNFEATVVRELCSLYGITKSRTTPYHPSGNGKTERLNQTLLNMLRTLSEEKQNRWPEFLPELLMAYNNMVHSVTGYTPAYLMFGRHCRLPADVVLDVISPQVPMIREEWVRSHHERLSQAFQLARKRTDVAANRSKVKYDRKATAEPLLPGERVWVRDRRRQGKGKLAGWWDPTVHVVIGQVGDTGVVYRVRPELGGKEKVLHRNALKVCVLVPQGAPVPPVAEVAQEPFEGGYVVSFQPRAEMDPQDIGPRRSNRPNFGRPPVRYGD